MLQNMDKTEHLESTTQDLADAAKTFHKTAVKARRHFWWQVRFATRAPFLGLHPTPRPLALSPSRPLALSPSPRPHRALTAPSPAAAAQQNLKFKLVICGILVAVLIIILAASGAFNGVGGGGDDGGDDGGDGGGGEQGGRRRLLFGA